MKQNCINKKHTKKHKQFATSEVVSNLSRTRRNLHFLFSFFFFSIRTQRKHARDTNPLKFENNVPKLKIQNIISWDHVFSTTNFLLKFIVPISNSRISNEWKFNNYVLMPILFQAQPSLPMSSGKNSGLTQTSKGNLLDQHKVKRSY